MPPRGPARHPPVRRRAKATRSGGPARRPGRRPPTGGPRSHGKRPVPAAARRSRRRARNRQRKRDGAGQTRRDEPQAPRGTRGRGFHRPGIDPDAPPPAAEQRYRDIADHGIIGDRHTAALVGTDGSIDWFCTPHFDSPSVFARLLDRERGGHFSIHLSRPAATRQSYIPDTNVLVTRFLAPEGMAELTDFMPLDRDPGTPALHRIVRRLHVLRGDLEFRLECRPAFDYGRARHRAARVRQGVRFSSRDLRLILRGDRPLRVERGGAVATFRLSAGQTATFVVHTEPAKNDRRVAKRQAEATPGQLLDETVDYWRRWIAKCTYQGRWREQVRRSALVLKLLTYEPSGAIVAAPTASLPETVGGARNWDYRFCWVRDSAFIVRALMQVGFVEEADQFMQWLMRRVEESEPKTLRPLYGVHGDLAEEQELDHLEGYRGSRPVRIGNDAIHHLQLDVYGALFDALEVYERAAPRITHDLWRRLAFLLDWLCRSWDKPDRGIWEHRGPPRHHTFSKLMCWVALDRGIRLAEARGLPGSLSRWRRERDRIYATVMEQGWNERKGAFTQTLGGDTLDASLALMPLVGFVAPRDPRMLSTLDAIQRELASGPLVLRHPLDDEGRRLGGEEGAFILCGFWLAQALTRAGEVESARRLFDGLAGFANHVGLFSEEIGASGESLGNFPQGLTHLALVEAAVELDRALEGR